MAYQKDRLVGDQLALPGGSVGTRRHPSADVPRGRAACRSTGVTVQIPYREHTARQQAIDGIALGRCGTSA
jgi:hypothetical protein